MKIAFIGQKGIPGIAGGVETHVENLSVELARAGHDVIVYTRPHYVDKKRTQYRGVRLVSVPHIYNKYLDAVSHTFLACLHVWRQRDVDIIHFQSIGPSLFIPFMRLLRPRTPIIVTFHSQCYHHSKWGWFARRVLHAGEWMACHMAQRVIAVSPILQEYVYMRYRLRANYIPNGIHENELAPPQQITEKYGLTKRGYILTLARMVKTKRFHDVIDAYNLLDTDVKLVIAYAPSHDDAYLAYIKEKAARNPRIIMIPHDQQTQQLRAELFSNAALYVLPSDAEGLAITLLEAMSYSAAVLTSDIVENANLVKDVGMTFRLGDWNDMARQMRALLDDAKLRSTCGARARAYVIKHFNWKKIAHDTSNLYREVVQVH